MNAEFGTSVHFNDGQTTKKHVNNIIRLHTYTHTQQMIVSSFVVVFAKKIKRSMKS